MITIMSNDSVYTSLPEQPYPSHNNHWNLFLDDLRFPYYVDPHSKAVWVMARNLDEAKGLCVRFGMPGFISFDHDLGPGEDAMMFCRWLAYEFYDKDNKNHKIPNYQVHSSNPVGVENIKSFMDSWVRAENLP